MNEESQPVGGNKTYGQMAAVALYDTGWDFISSVRTDAAGEEEWCVRAWQDGREIIVTAPDEGIALLEVERQVKELK